MPDNTWELDADDLHDGEWFQWNLQVAEERPELTPAVADFEAYSRNEAAAKEGTEWFRDKSAELARILQQAAGSRPTSPRVA